MIGAAFDRARLRRARPVPTEALGTGRALGLDGGGYELRAWLGGPTDASLTVVVVPDPPNVLEHHVAQLDGLSEGARVLGLELPGFGRSGVPHAFDFAIESYAESLSTALDQHTDGPLLLVFSCLAGLIALEIAARNERVAGLLLVQTPSLEDARGWAGRVDPGGLLRKPLLGQMIVRAGRRRLAKTWYDAALPRGTARDPYLSEALAAYDAGGDYCLASAVQSLGAAKAVPSLALPTTVLWGGSDRTHRPSDPHRLEPSIDGLRVRTVDGAGHFPDLEAPEVFDDELRKLRARIG